MPKSSCTFFPEPLRRQIRENGQDAETVDALLGWFLNQSFETLAEQVFPPHLKRSWFVLSSGNCPSCRKSVPMYDWKIDVLANPWKVRCPHCEKRFPTNDFHAYYRSGLSADGIFDPRQANRRLLVNEEGGTFGVDDGNGYEDEEGNRWLFIAAYLVHGHWKEFLIPGLTALAYGYIRTCDRNYSRRALILLYRISQFFPDYDWKSQGVMYEETGRQDGYVGYWALSSTDLPTLALAYDMVFETREDVELLNFLGVDSASLQQSIESRIFEDALSHPEKFDANPPNPQNAEIIMKAVLGWPENRNEVMEAVDSMISLCTKIDGLVGEKGLSGYTALGPRGIAHLLLLMHNADPEFFRQTLRQFPILHQTFRFHIDTWYRCRYYPGVGDSGTLGSPSFCYAPLQSAEQFQRPYTHNLEWFLLQLAEAYQDPDFYKTLYWSNGKRLDGLFESDPLTRSPESLQQQIKCRLEEEGEEFNQISKLFPAWRLVLLYSGHGKNQRLFWLNYDSGANHANHEALNIGCFAFGLNLMSTFGYPPVSRGGWHTPEFQWYRKPASHNLVVIDGKEHTNLAEGRFIRYPQYGKASLQGANTEVQLVAAQAPEYAGAERYERLCLQIDVDAENSYLIDGFFVRGGDDHTFFLRSSFASLQSEGLQLSPGEPYGHGTFMRHFQTDRNPPNSFWIDFQLEDPFQMLDPGPPVHLRYHSLTEARMVTLAESWVDTTNWQARKGGTQDTWIPTLMVRRHGPESAFLGVLEPYREKKVIREVLRLESSDPGITLLKIKLQNGGTDWLVLRDPGDFVKALETKAPGAKKRFSEIGIGDEAGQYKLVSSAVATWIRLRNGTVESMTSFGGSAEIKTA